MIFPPLIICDWTARLRDNFWSAASKCSLQANSLSLYNADSNAGIKLGEFARYFRPIRIT